MKAPVMKVKEQSNFDPTEEIQMSFDEKGHVKLAAVLVNLYSDLASAIIREYAANAWDSHVAAGHTRPIWITLPTHAKPEFRVKDQGVGMSLGDIRAVVSKYGASTKDEDPNQIGAYGLGCKSGLSMVPSFTITAIKDGIKNVVTMAREENSLGKITPIMQLETDEPNGVEIAIAINSDYKEFAKKVSRVFFTWDKGTVLIDGKPPTESMYDETQYMPVGNGAYLSVHKQNNNHNSGFYNAPRGGLTINMGGIGYPVEVNQYQHLIDMARRKGSVSPGKTVDHNMVINVPIGSVDLIPSRESIQWTTRSNEQVAKRLKETYDLILETIRKKIEAYTDREDLFCPEVHELAESFSEQFQSGDITWKGQKFPGSYSFEPLKLAGSLSLNSASNYHAGRKANRGYSINFEFGFTHSWNKSSIEYGENVSFHNTWIFVDCHKSDLTPSELHHHTKSVIKAKKITGNVTAVYMVDDSMNTDIWLKTALSKDKTNLFSFTAEEFVELSVAFRKEQSRLSRQAAKSVETPYSVSVLGKDQWGKPKRSIKAMTFTEMQEHLEDNPTVEVFADEVIFSTKNKEHEESSTFFLPDTALVVYMRGARKADTFVKKAPFPVRTDLADFMAKSLVEKIEEIGFEKYFANVHVASELRIFGRKLKLQDGFLKNVFEKDYDDYETRIFLGHMNVFKKVEGAVLPEIPFVIKSRKIVEEGCLFFEDPMPWNIDGRSKAYSKQMKNYILSVSDTIEKIAKG